MFGHLLGLGSFDSLEGLLAHKQSSFTITFGGIGFISIATIILTTYLKSWALVILIIVIKFMVDNCFFLLKVLTQVDNNTFPFQQHFKTTCNLLLPPVHACFLPFEQLIEQQMVQLQDSISKHLHHHTFSNVFFDMILKAHHV
jgi:hypothetical protein